MPSNKIIHRLLAVLRLGGSDQIHEADTAFRKAVSIMEEQGIAIDALLDRISKNDLPQSVIAELARRYCLSRTDRGPSDREDYYRTVFCVRRRESSPRNGTMVVLTPP
jgi:hypothetical protein